MLAQKGLLSYTQKNNGIEWISWFHKEINRVHINYSSFALPKRQSEMCDKKKMKAEN